ncbi:MAG TPA: hypothetical protein VNA25_02930 [Phycisphaerae bacterium]|nr:hypothetical protein [Phycisphaerae bacterium]
MNLTREERIKFALWIRQQADDCGKVADQMAKLPGMSTVMTKHLKAEVVAYLFVAERVKPGEEMTIGPDDVGEKPTP